MTYQLPPRPDPQTGEPRPPAAPTTKWGSTGDRKEPSKVPEKAFHPPGRGPALEYKHTSGKDALKDFVWAFGLFFILACIGWWVTTPSTATSAAMTFGNPIGWMTVWYMWLALLVPSVPYALVKYNKTISTGADWISNGKNYWVDLYDLKAVDMSFAGTNYYLRLTDNSEHKCELKLYDMEWTPRRWDLIYNGILHCYANGTAKVNSMAVGTLKLDSSLEQYKTSL